MLKVALAGSGGMVSGSPAGDHSQAKEQNLTTKETDADIAFDQLGLSETILKSLAAMGYTDPTPIQQQAIPLVVQGHDVLGLAQTGTGKTAAFGLPLVHQLLPDGTAPAALTVRALILSPTRELANQIGEALKMFVKNTHLRVAIAVGGQSINTQARRLQRGNDFLVATPGRLLDLIDRKAVTLSETRFLVLDEADQMLDLGFIHALKRIAKLVPAKRQTLLFSATMPKEIEGLAEQYLRDPVRVQVAPPGQTADKVSQGVYHVSRRGKADLLISLLAQRPDDLSIVFARTKHGAEKLRRVLEAAGLGAASIHGNKSQSQRERAIREFKSGEMRILVATDVAARGIDIPGVSHVYNYDLPEVPAQYVHRIGRTARAGLSGDAIAFCAPDEAHLLKAIEKSLRKSIPVLGNLAHSGEADEPMPETPRRSARKKPKERGKQKAVEGEAGQAPNRRDKARRQRPKIKGRHTEQAAPVADFEGAVSPVPEVADDANAKGAKRRKPRKWQRNKGKQGANSDAGASSKGGARSGKPGWKRGGKGRPSGKSGGGS